MENVKNITSENGFGGKLLGVSVHSFLQMLESEQKTCTIRVTYQGKKGYLYLNNGELIGAHVDSLRREAAAYEIIGWDEPVIEIKYTVPEMEREVFQPLMSVLMEGIRLKDEKLSDAQLVPAGKDGHKFPELKSKPTAGRRIGLDIGAKLQIEIIGLDSPFESFLVGMIPEEFLIITLPPHFSANGHKLSKGARLAIKYLYLGKICVFNAELQASVDFRQKLLFISYPSFVHYRELRRHRRVKSFLPCTINLSNDQSYPGVIIDMSISGCLYQQKNREDNTLPPLQIDEKLTIRCLLPGIDEKQELTARIRNLNKTENETRIGMEFVENPPAVEKVITHYLEQ
jgi:c-di-GMP-binding flagellar brake protein YcgR